MGKPKIRFEGYSEDWEQRKFGDYNDLMTGYPFESDKFSEDGIKLVRGMNVKRGYLDFSGDICVKWNSCVGLEKFLLKDGDILIQMDGALIGKSYAKIKENQLPALLVQRVTRARTNNKFASQDFMYQTIQRDFLRYIEMNKTETAVPHLSLNDIRNFEIMVPCLAEQKKIGEYFDSLDNLITLHQRKCDETKTLKKYMLQKMFPQNGEKVPEIRFDGFTEDWEQRKLGDLIEDNIIIEQSDGNHGELYPRSDEFTDAGIPYIAASAISSSGDDIDFNLVKYLPLKRAEQFRKGVAQNGDILLAHNATVGPCLQLSMEYDFAILSTSLTLFRINENKMNSKFFLQMLRSDLFQNQLFKYMKQTTRSQVPILTQRKLEVCYPNNTQDQELIGTYLSNLDHLITLHQRKCNELKEIKKYMLQNMFV